MRYEALGKFKDHLSYKKIAHLLKLHAGACEIFGSPRELMTLRVAQFVLKIAQLAMEARGLGACGFYSDYGSSTNQYKTNSCG